MNRDADKEQDMLSDIVLAVCTGTGMREDVAIPIAKNILFVFQQKHGGERMYIPMPQRAHNMLQILADLRNGKSKKVVRREHNITRFQLDRILEEATEKKVG